MKNIQSILRKAGEQCSPLRCSTRKRKGYTLTELMLSMLILAILGGVVVSAFDLMFASFRQTDEQITSRYEIEFALSELRPQFTNIGLGMPNSRAGTDSFQKGFTAIGGIAARMTAPVTISGDELLYAWAEPTDILIDKTKHTIIYDESTMISTIAPNDISLHSPFTVADLVQKSFLAGNPASSKSWILFPSLRIPIHCQSAAGTDKLNVDVNPGFAGILAGLSEVHLLRVGKLYLEDGKLMRDIQEGEQKRALAYNVSSVKFKFEPDRRLLTMTITPSDNAGRPLDNLTESITWRIRN